MPSIEQSSVRNRLLKTMSADDFALLQPHLRAEPAVSRQVLITPDVGIEHLYFPEHGFTSVTIDASGGPVEVGMIGNEGLVGATPVLLGVHRTPHDFFVQMPGDNLAITNENLCRAVARSLTLRDLLLRYVQAFLVQTTQTAFVNAVFDLEVRLARWLLMCQDRSSSHEINITHEFLSMMLGVRRPGVTVATQVLEGEGFIKAFRGQIRIVNRDGLMALAEESYGLPEKEYELLIGGGPPIDVNGDGL